MSGRNSQVVRILTLLQVLEGAPHGLTVTELVDRLVERGLDSHKRTIYRDIEALQRAGFPLIERDRSDDNGVRWALDRTSRITQHLSLSPSELVALFLAKNVLGFLKDSPLYSDLLQAFSKFEDKLGAPARAYFTELSDGIFFEPASRWGKGIDEAIFTVVQNACLERHCLKVTYHSAHSNTVNERILGPECLYFAHGAFYLIAKDFGDQQVKVFSLTRLKAAAMLEDGYDAAELDPASFFGNSFGVFRSQEAPTQVVLRFHPTLSSYVKERRWHNSQVLRDGAGGAVELTLHVGLTPDLVQWVLSFGDKVTVLEPALLRTAIKNEAEKLVAKYGVG